MTTPASLRIASLLIVDDSGVQRAHAAALCRALGVQMIYEAASGAEALELLSLLVLPPELMIVDLEMPQMDGVELIQQLHARGARIPLIVASSRELILIETVETMARNLGLPVVCGLQKPLASEPVRDALARFAAESSPAGAESAGAPAWMTERQLATAIEMGAIGVHFQPKVDMATGIVRGVEALARWTHPEFGHARPDHFVALAERSDLILALTRAVAGQALAQAARWNAQGLKLSMAINLSPRILGTPGLVQEIATLADRHRVAPGQVVLEITESSVVEGLGDALGVLARLRLKGFGLSIDDYGTGFSSMQQLARIPFTEMKIDRSFVHGAHERTNLRVILESALGMARQLGLATVAEGIETMEDWRLLQQAGCQIGQGWLTAKAMPAEHFRDWLRRHHARLPALRMAAPSKSA
jgi:EAL domain-containing protein (putative c-di-GMP-specific phosphodiesterase class I)/FixJ family two-component response regulator